MSPRAAGRTDVVPLQSVLRQESDWTELWNEPGVFTGTSDPAGMSFPISNFLQNMIVSSEARETKITLSWPLMWFFLSFNQFYIWVSKLKADLGMSSSEHSSNSPSYFKHYSKVLDPTIWWLFVYLLNMSIAGPQPVSQSHTSFEGKKSKIHSLRNM